MTSDSTTLADRVKDKLKLKSKSGFDKFMDYAKDNVYVAGVRKLKSQGILILNGKVLFQGALQQDSSLELHGHKFSTIKRVMVQSDLVCLMIFKETFSSWTYRILNLKLTL